MPTAGGWPVGNSRILSAVVGSGGVVAYRQLPSLPVVACFGRGAREGRHEDRWECAWLLRGGGSCFTGRAGRPRHLLEGTTTAASP